MEQWNIEQTESFEKHFKKIIPKHLRKQVKKQMRKLGNNPYNSKPLGLSFFREKKIERWRIYFILHEHKLIIYFIDVSDKKLQQQTINKIKLEFKKYLEDFDKMNIT